MSGEEFGVEENRPADPARAPVDESNRPRRMSDRSTWLFIVVMFFNLVWNLRERFVDVPQAVVNVVEPVLIGLLFAVVVGMFIWALTRASLRTTRIVAVCAGLVLGVAIRIAGAVWG